MATVESGWPRSAFWYSAMEDENRPSLRYESPAALCESSYLREGRFSSSIAEYQKALLDNPDSTVATAVYFNLAIAYYSEKNIQGAVNALEKLVVLKPQDVEAQYNLGCLKLYRRDLKESTACFNKASCCCNPDSPFFSPVHQGLALAQVLQTADPNTQNLIFLLLEKGMLSRNP